MTVRQYNEMLRQATVTQTRVQRVIELQTHINQQIDKYGYATDEAMVDEMDLLIDQLSDREIGILSNFISHDDMEYEDIEDQIN